MARMTARISPLVTLALAAGLWIGLPAAAEIYHVNLDNGASYESRYAPEEASWDRDTLLFITETGNWVGIERDRVTSIEIETELRGYGDRINATTIHMGRTPHSAPVEEDLSPAEQQNQLLQTLIDQQQGQPDYTMDQFVEPGGMGRGQGGIPLGFTNQATPPMGVAVQNPQ